MKILIVEDEKPLSDSMVEYLSEEGHHSEAVYTYNDAVEKIRMYQYDCAVVDINLPDGNGLDLIRMIKKQSITLGIIIISALNSLENRIEGLEIGADNYLTKPFHLAELNSHLKSINRRISYGGNNQIVVNEIRLIPDEHMIFVHEVQVTLTKKEYEQLKLVA